jgi:superfamily II DNA/RNA helicase
LFSTLLLDEPLLNALELNGFSEMTEVQQAAIPQALKGKDLIVNAKTGSGKTLAYLLPMLQQILDNPHTGPQALILAPTRELCRQINKQCSLLSQFTGIKSTVIIGGEDPKYQIKALERCPDIIIATPGRLLGHAKRNVVNLDEINILVIDEADRMLDMGFSNEVITIAKACSNECQCVMYSASFKSNKFKKLTDQILYQPVTIMVDSTREYNHNVTQKKILVDDNEHKLKLLQHILQGKDSNIKFNRAIVFANKKDSVNQISSWLQSKQINTSFMHSDINQETRNAILRDFRNNKINVIIATDVVSRGLDINGLDLIINYDVPRDGEDYMHRIGRTGRMFDTGLAITFVDSPGWNRMISIENFLGIKLASYAVEDLPAHYTGPLHRKSSGKAYGTKRKQHDRKKTEHKRKKTKERIRNRKNIGKRRKPSENQDNNH